jgi:hypothetical protein
MMKLAGLAAVAFAIAINFSLPGTAVASAIIDSRILGTWTTTEADCPAVLQRAHGKAALELGGSLIVSSFVINRRSIDTSAGRCTPTSAHTKGPIVELALECWNSVSIETRQISIKVIGPDEIEYQYPRTPELSQRFRRCKRSSVHP